MVSIKSPRFRLEKLSHHYPGGIPALLDVTADIPAGKTVAVLGPSGSGKSTLLSLLGLLWDGEGTTGELWFGDGQDQCSLLRLAPTERAALRSMAFGFVLQSSYLLPHFTCLENLTMPLALQGWPKPAREAWADALLERVDPRGDLRDKRNCVPRQVSLGQRQRYSVLRAVISDPMVVLADEPSSNLDPGSTEAMFQILKDWQDATLFHRLQDHFAADRTTPALIRRWLEEHASRSLRTLLLVCHDIQTARELADQFLLLNKDHKLENDATVEQVLGSPPGGAGRDVS